MNKEFKTYKEFLNESEEINSSRFPLTDPEKVKQWVKENLQIKTGRFQGHHLSGDWSVDDEGYFSTTGNLNLDNMNLHKLPFRIKFIGGNFSCENNKLTNFKGLEKLESIENNFWCCDNQLTSLEGLENLKFIGKTFLCNDNRLTNLKGLEKLEYVGRNATFYNNYLTTLKGLESLKVVEKNLAIENNNLISLKDLKSLESVGGNFSCNDNKLLSKKVPFEVKGNIEVEPQGKYEDSIEYLVSLSEEEQKKIIEYLMDFDPQAYRKLTNYTIKNNIELPLDQEAKEWNKEATDLEDTGLEF